MEVRYLPFMRPSSCGEGDLFTHAWLPEKPSAIIQISHGMQEHAGRYARFARHLAENGWAVYANDHIGHGKSALGHMGTLSLKPDGFEYLLLDMHSLMAHAAAQFPGLPKVLIGHSMGSIATGIYPKRFDDADALILLGAPAPNPFAGFGIALADSHIRRKGQTSVSPFLTRLVEATTSGSSKDPMEHCAWLSRDPEQIRRVVEDPLCGRAFSASAYRELFRGLREFSARDWGASVKEMPILIASGSEDNCGNKGAGPKHYYDALLAAGHRDVTLKIYEGAHHELLNEINRDEVEEMLIGFIRDRLARLSKG